MKNEHWYYVLQMAARYMRQGLILRSMWCANRAERHSNLYSIVWC
jgi:hypothetical protein